MSRHLYIYPFKVIFSIRASTIWVVLILLKDSIASMYMRILYAIGYLPLLISKIII